jgi:hypothetical protein
MNKNKLKWIILLVLILFLNISGIIFNRNIYDDLVFLAVAILVPTLITMPVIEYYLKLPMYIPYVGEIENSDEKLPQRKIFLIIYLSLSIWAIASMYYVFVFKLTD